jgi:tRNA dimethylallyltransferase
MLYFRALIQGLDEVPDYRPQYALTSRPRQRARLASHASTTAEVDPVTAERLHPNHSQRICRALEVHRGTGSR